MYSYINTRYSATPLLATPLFAPYDYPCEMLYLRQGSRR